MVDFPMGDWEVSLMMYDSDGGEAGENKRRKSMELSGWLRGIIYKVPQAKQALSQKLRQLRSSRRMMKLEETTHPTTEDRDSHY